MKFDYKKRYNHKLELSKRQLEQLSALHVVNWFMENNKLDSLPNINPRWIEKQKYNNFPVYHFEELQKKGKIDLGRIKIRRAKKGYVLEMTFNWRSKNITTAQIPCIKCKKLKKLNYHNFCEKCTKEVKGSKGIIKFWRSLQNDNL